MTPFGAKLRDLRRARGIALKDMAKGLGVSAAYLSALEHGHRGRPNRAFVHRICAYFNIIWDEAEELQARAQLSPPRVPVDTAGLSPEQTELANRLAARSEKLDAETVRRMLELLNGQASDRKG